jgi:hypothetical protein
LNFVDDNNLWAQHVRGGVEVHVVGGDHDSMVLEPHVRVMASEFRACLDGAMRDATVGASGPAAGADAARVTLVQPSAPEGARNVNRP